MKSDINIVLKCILWVVLCFILMLLLTFLRFFIFNNFHQIGKIDENFFLAVISFIMLIGALLFIKKIKKTFLFKEALKYFKIKYFLISIILGVLIPLLVTLLFNFFDIVNLIYNTNTKYFSYKFLLITSTSLINSVWEELFFRGVIFKELTSKYSFFFSVIFSSLLFSLFHFGGFYKIIYSFLCGIFAAVLLFKYKSIIYPIVFHGTWNLYIDCSDIM